MNENTAFIIFRFALIAVELAVFLFLFLCTAKKRKLWALRSLLLLAVVLGIVTGLCFAIANLYSAVHYDRVIVSLVGAAMQLLILLLLGGGLFLCFDVKFYELASLVSLGYASRWILFSLYSLLFNFINPNLFLIRIHQQTPLNIAIYAAIYTVYIGVSAFLIYRRKDEKYTLKLPSFIAAVIIILLNTFLLSFAETNSEEHLLEYSYVLISNVISLSLIIAINFFTTREERLAVENKLINSMLVQQTQQYKFDKANSEMLHVKAHDLKHQVAVLRKGGPEAERLLDELDSVVYGYESVVLTDNPVINVTLSEKWQYCIKHKIKMTCSVDPKALQKMDNIHLYSMLGNILDNAIEAVMQIKDKEKRLISLSIAYNRGASLLRCYNYYEGSLKMEGGLPKTTKGDASTHGYGMKSIKNIVDLYDGELSIAAENGIFDLRITLFDPSEE